MTCPECGDELVYEEYVDGSYIYTISQGVIVWSDGELRGECYGHTIRCRNDDCDYELPTIIFNQILDCSLENNRKGMNNELESTTSPGQTAGSVPIRKYP